MDALQGKSNITHVIFDLDGLILDVGRCYNELMEKLLEPYGKCYSTDLMIKSLGLKWDDVLALIVAELELPCSVESLKQETNRLYPKIFEDIRLLPGVLKVVHHLRKCDVGMAVATGSSKEGYLFKSKNFLTVFSCFSHAITSSDPDVKTGKPSPEIFLICTSKFAIEPSNYCQVLVFEDAPNGIEAAVKAGMKAVMIPCKDIPDSLKTNATDVLETFHDFKPEIYGLPPYRYRSVSHVIFDMDGLILDTEVLYSLATQKVLDKFGKHFSYECKMKMMGKLSHEAALVAISEYNLPLTVDEWLAQTRAEYKNVFPGACLKDGAEKLIRHLHNHGIPIAVATSSCKPHYDLKTTRHGALFSLFHHVVLGGSDPEVPRGKPSPDIFLTAAGRFKDGAAMDKCLVFEDAPNGVTAAKNAGMQVVMVPDLRTSYESTMEATQVIHSLGDFKPDDFGLPPFEK